MIFAASPRDTRWWLAAGLAIGLIGIAIRLWLYQEPVNSDDVQYWGYAVDGSLGGHANGLRMMLLAIPMVLAKLLGPNGAAFYLTIYLFAALSFAAIFSFAAVLAGARAAAITAAIWATSFAAISVDTRLTPDNLGTAFALFGLAVIAHVGKRDISGPPAETARARRRVIAGAFAGGALLWCAFATRETFFVFGMAGMAVAMLSPRRWLVTLGVAAGLLIGELAEVCYFWLVFDDPFARWKVLLGYAAAVSEAGDAGSATSAYAGYTVSDLFLRYPRLLAETDVVDTIVYFVGLVGVAWWIFGWRQREKLAKALCTLLAYGFLTFAIADIDPVVPLLREKIRYYATCAPLFSLATAELIELAAFRALPAFSLGRWLDGRPRRALVAALVGIALIANLAVASGRPMFARNGNDGLVSATDVIDADSRARKHARRLYTDFRTSRVLSILLPVNAGWEYGAEFDAVNQDRPFEITADGYMVLNWKRLNADVWSAYHHSERVHQFYRMLESHALVVRHRRRADLVDVFAVSPRPLDRRIEILDAGFPAGWSHYSRRDKLWAAVSAGGATFRRGASDEMVYSGPGRPWERPGGSTATPGQLAAIPGDRFVEAVVDARSAERGEMSAYLHWWPEGHKQSVQQYMGQVVVKPGHTEYAFWTYLPQTAQSYRVVLRADKGVAIHGAVIKLLHRHAADRMRQEGDAWSIQPVGSPGIKAAAAAVRSDVATAKRPRLIYTGGFPASAASQLFAADAGWRAQAGDGGRDPGYVIIDWEHVAEKSRAPGASTSSDPGAAIETHALVFRHTAKTSLTDALFAPARPLARRKQAVADDFPRGWSRYMNSRRQWQPLDPAAPVTFTSKTASEEYIYSGSDLPYRPRPGSQRLDGDQFVQASVELAGPSSGSLRAYLYWSSSDKKVMNKQYMGTTPARPERRTAVLWTYLPRDADSYRIVLRGSAGVTVSACDLHLLSREPADQIRQSGGAW